MLMCTVSVFAQWTKPEPKLEPMAADGSYQYMYNIEAGGFLVGANDYGTRASLSTSYAWKVKILAAFEDEEKTVPLGTYQICDSVEAGNAKGKWSNLDCQSFDQIWIDGAGRGGADMWRFVDLGGNKYEFTNDNVIGKFGMAKKFDGAANNRLFMLSTENESLLDNDEKVRYEGECTTWGFVSEAEYLAMAPKLAAYAAAMTLKEKMDAAASKYSGIDLSEANAVYSNTENNDSILTAALSLVDKAIANYQKQGVTAENPADFTDLVPNADFEKGIDGWQFTTGAQNKGQATNKGVQADYPGTTITGNFLENWNPNSFAGKIYTELANLPDGVYKVTMDATASSGQDTWVYANNDSTRTGGVDSFGEGGKELGDTAYKFSLYTIVGEDGKLEIGLRNNTDCTNWIGIDNVTLTYYGSEVDAYKFWYNETRQSLIATMDAMVDDDTKYDKTQKDVFTAALAKGDAASSKEEIMEAVADLTSAANATMASIAAYSELKKQCDIIETDLSDLGDVMDLVLLFSDFFRADEEDAAADALNELKESDIPEELMIEVAPYLLLEVCNMPTDEVVAYTEKLVGLFKYCLANSITPGMDFTSLISDATFTDPNGKGWTVAKKGGNFSLYGGIVPDQEKSVGMPVAECWHGTFDIYQEVTAPDGIYSLSLNGYCRLVSGRVVIPAGVYLNDFSSKFMNYYDGGVAEADAVDGFNAFITSGIESTALTQNPQFMGCKIVGPGNGPDKLDNGMYYPDGMAGAGVAFAAGRYEAKVYGIVEGGKMKIGVRNLESDGEWVVWSNFKLTYEGKNAKAVAALATSFVANANSYLEENGDNMSTVAASALTAAIAAVEDAEGDGDAQYDAIIALNQVLAEAKENSAAYVACSNAKDEMSAAADEFGEACAPSAIAAYNAVAEEDITEKTTEQLIALTEQFKAVTAALRLPNTEGASDDNPIAMTQVIINPDFQANTAGQQATGWTLVKGEGASGNYQVQNGFDGGVSMEFWSDTNGSGTKYDFYQDIANLPAGTYELKVDAANSYNGQQPGPGEGYACVYAATGAGEDFVYGTAAIETQIDGCADSHKTYSVIVVLKEGETLRIGSKNVDELSARWVMIDNFELTYYGADSKKNPSVDAIESTTAVSTVSAIYNLAGQKVDKLAKGINIIKMSDNSVRKVLVK